MWGGGYAAAPPSLSLRGRGSRGQAGNVMGSDMSHLQRSNNRVATAYGAHASAASRQGGNAPSTRG